MKNSIRSGLMAAVLVTAMFLFVSCENLSVLMAQLDDDVKLANDRYLEVVETFPEQNDQNLSPKIELLVTLDRDIDPETLKRYLLIEQRNTEGTVTAFGDSEDVTEELEMEFSSSDKTLSIRPSPFWAGGDKITVSLLPGAMALDGSVLRSLYSWSFYTVKVPIGTIDIVDGPNAQPGYSPTDKPDVNIAFSNAGEYYLDSEKAYIDDFSSSDSWGWKSNSVKSGEESPTIADVFPIKDGTGTTRLSELLPGWNTIYAVFKDPATNTLSDPVSDIVFIDDTDPVSDADNGNIAHGPYGKTFSWIGSATDTGGSGIAAYQWSASSGYVSFGSANSTVTTITGQAGVDPYYTIYLTATDKAGNTDTDFFTLDWDDQAPAAPAFTSVPTSPTTDNTPFWNWDPSTSTHDAITPYYYRLYYTSSAWSTTANSYLYSGTLNDGYHRFDVGQYDDAGNFSYSTDYLVVNVAQISPYDTQTNVPRTFGVVLDWPSLIGTKVTYEIYSGIPPTKPPTRPPTPIYSGSSTSGRSPALSLSSSQSYYWGYSYSHTTKGPFTFRTGK